MNRQTESIPAPCYSYRFGTAEFDEARFELRVAGLPVEVERRALEVLAYLLRHAGEVVTKDELLREVWAGRITVDKVLPNAIAKLRRALGEANAAMLLTQARVGYRLEGTISRVATGRMQGSRLQLEAGAAVPGRGNFVLRRQLGHHRGSEVWLAEHARTHERRVYKFATDADRLRALKREATLSRVLLESLEDRRHFVELIDWNFEQPPFFLECGFGGQNLLEWAEEGRLAAATQTQRLEVFLQVADAVADAHAVGVLHKDLKPANVLIAVEGDGWLVRLTDFGSGRLLDPGRLAELGITRLGLTLTQGVSVDSSSGTPLYLAPEVIAGHVPTVRSDVYALGILLYQLLAGELRKPLASGWEQDIDDPVLREDIRLATDGNPEWRIAEAATLAQRLRDRDVRRDAAERAQASAEQNRRAREALARSRVRRPWLVALFGALAAGVVVVSALYRSAVEARNDAQRQLERATAINRFVNEDLIGRSNPLVLAKGQDASLKDLLLGARERVAGRFGAQPLAEASIRTSLATLFNMLELLPEAEDEARRALALHERVQGADSLDALKAQALLARLLTRTGKFEESKSSIDALERSTAGTTDPYRRYLLASARGIWFMNTGDYAKALPEYRAAIPLLREVEPDNFTLRDSMRMDLIGALTQTGALAEARAEGESLIAEIGTRADDNGLVVAFARAALARTYTLEGDTARAESELIDAQRTIVHLLGEDHTRNLMVLSDLYDVAMKRHDWPAATDYARRVHEGFHAKFGDAHNVSNLTLANWGTALYESGDARGAQARLQPAQARLAARLTPANPQAQVATFWLAAALLDDGGGDIDAAARLVDGLDAKALEAAGADGLWQARVDALRGLVLVRRGDLDAAQLMLRGAIERLGDNAAGSGRLLERARAAMPHRLP